MKHLITILFFFIASQSFSQTYDINMKLRPEQSKDSVQVLITDVSWALKGRGHWHNLTYFSNLLAPYYQNLFTTNLTQTASRSHDGGGYNQTFTNLGNWTFEHTGSAFRHWGHTVSNGSNSGSISIYPDELNIQSTNGSYTSSIGLSPTSVEIQPDLTVVRELNAGHIKHSSEINAVSTSVTLTSTASNILTLKASGAKTVDLPDATANTVGLYYIISNRSSSGTLTVRALGSGDSASGIMTLLPGESATWECTDNNYWDHK